MRQIILDTETTGLDPKSGDRLVEIGCIEVVNYIPTGRVYQTYLNPQRDVPSQATAVHGLTQEFLKDHPLFEEVVEEFLNFLQESPLVIHNAEFDLKFLNAELKRLERDPLPNSIIDTLWMARRKFPGSPANLNALCQRFKIDNSSRTYHGALLDCELLSAVYLELNGGRQQGLKLSQEQEAVSLEALEISTKLDLPTDLKPSRQYKISPEELEKHQAFLKTFF